MTKKAKWREQIQSCILAPTLTTLYDRIQYGSYAGTNRISKSSLLVGVHPAMIKGIIIVNNHGNPRLAKFYQTVEGEAAQQRVISRIFQQVSSRPDSFCNYLEGQDVPYWGSDVKLIYRHYATLYFVFAVDSQESDLGILDLIQVFVECLDKCFENVCELDLIFGYPQLNNILDEIVRCPLYRVADEWPYIRGAFLRLQVMGGMVLETNIVSILQAVQDQDKLHKDSMRTSTLTKPDATSVQQRIGGNDMTKWQYNW